MTYALPANVTPNYIFPFTPGQYFTIVNTDNLQYLLYRPLYWWGDQGLAVPEPRLSLAEPPHYQGQTVTITLKHGYRWSNGESVTAKDVMFWMNMMKAEARQHRNWGGYVPGDFPDNVKNIHAVGTDKVQMTIIGKYSPALVHRQRAEPDHADAAGVGPDQREPEERLRATMSVTALAVFKYLNALSQNTKTWAHSPLWKHRRRALAADRSPLAGRADLQLQPEATRASAQAPHHEVHRGTAVHLRGGRVQRAAGGRR